MRLMLETGLDLRLCGAVAPLDACGRSSPWAVPFRPPADKARTCLTRWHDVFPGPLEETTDEQWARSIAAKGMGQINMVHAALPHIADRGSFTLVSGVLADEFTLASSIGTTVNHMVEGVVIAAGTEMPRRVRINYISPAVLAESEAYHRSFPGFTPVPAAEVTQAYLRAMSTQAEGGHVVSPGSVFPRNSSPRERDDRGREPRPVGCARPGKGR
jgi:NAD(P)-dependent dehydrogenase (short-subunit alcohol dehydrogenase family)